jgi:hypothetical protein
MPNLDAEQKSNLALIDKYADQYGVPRWIVEDIAYVESGWHNSPVGDNGQSFGLLQLYQKGQGAGYAGSYLKDPVNNLNIGMPYIAAGYRAAAQEGRSGYDLLKYTAGYSGHNGGSPGHFGMDGNYNTLLSGAFSTLGGSAQFSGQGWGAGQVYNPAMGANIIQTSTGTEVSVEAQPTAIQRKLYEKAPLKNGTPIEFFQKIDEMSYIYDVMPNEKAPRDNMAQEVAAPFKDAGTYVSKNGGAVALRGVWILIGLLLLIFGFTQLVLASKTLTSGVRNLI